MKNKIINLSLAFFVVALLSFALPTIAKAQDQSGDFPADTGNSANQTAATDTASTQLDSAADSASQDLTSTSTPGAQINETLEGKITKILEEKMITPEGATTTQLYQKLQILVTKGSLKGQTIVVENGNLEASGLQQYKLNDQVVINFSKDYAGNNLFEITDYVRRSGLLVLFLAFALTAIVIGRWRGFTSLIAMGLSFVVIFEYILPQIYAGQDPITIAIIGSLIIVPTTFFLSHGFNKKTVIAIIGTVITLFITALLAYWASKLTLLTGFGSEDVNFLQDAKASINVKDLMLAGIVIGSLGILNDITISQSAIVLQLKEASEHLSVKELYQRAMKVGHDHIASMINTLVLVYSGAALPLLLLFINGAQPFTSVINTELIADEIVKTLVMSIGLILAVPLTTYLAALAFARKD